MAQIPLPQLITDNQRLVSLAVLVIIFHSPTRERTKTLLKKYSGEWDAHQEIALGAIIAVIIFQGDFELARVGALPLVGLLLVVSYLFVWSEKQSAEEWFVGLTGLQQVTIASLVGITAVQGFGVDIANLLQASYASLGILLVVLFVLYEAKNQN